MKNPSSFLHFNLTLIFSWCCCIVNVINVFIYLVTSNSFIRLHLCWVCSLLLSWLIWVKFLSEAVVFVDWHVLQGEIWLWWIVDLRFSILGLSRCLCLYVNLRLCCMFLSLIFPQWGVHEGELSRSDQWPLKVVLVIFGHLMVDTSLIVVAKFVLTQAPLFINSWLCVCSW